MQVAVCVFVFVSLCDWDVCTYRAKLENDTRVKSSHLARKPIVWLALPQMGLVLLTHVVLHLQHDDDDDGGKDGDKKCNNIKGKVLRASSLRCQRTRRIQRAQTAPGKRKNLTHRSWEGSL